MVLYVLHRHRYNPCVYMTYRYNIVTVVCHQLRHAREVELAGQMEAYKCITSHYGTTVTN